MVVGRPEPEATPGGGAACTTRALVGGGAGNFPDEEGVDAAARIEGGGAGEAGIDDRADAGDRKGGFRDVGGDDDFWSVRWADGLFLIGRGQGGIEWENVVGLCGCEVV